MATEKAPKVAETGLACGKDARDLYQGAMQRLISKAYEERAEFPLSVSVTNGQGEAWCASVTLTGNGSEFCCKHHDFFGSGMAITFPIRMVATDANDDVVASIDVALVDPPRNPSRN